MEVVVSAPCAPLCRRQRRRGALRRAAVRLDRRASGGILHRLVPRPHQIPLRGLGPPGASAPAGDWTGRNKRLVRAPFADVLARPEVESPVLDTLPGGAGRPRRGGRGGLAKIALPDGREGYTKCSLWEDDYKTPPAVSRRPCGPGRWRWPCPTRAPSTAGAVSPPGRGLLGADLHGLVLLRGVPLPGRPAGGRLSRAAHPL